MRLAHSLIVLLAAVTAAASPHVTSSNPVTPTAPSSAEVLDLPVTFERNAGQFSADVDFVSRTQGQALSVNARGATVVVGNPSGARQEIRLRFLDARPDAATLGGTVVSYANYIQGNDPSRWLTGVSAHESVRYGGVYDGIDVEYHARRGALEYDVIVAPGADWRKVSFAIDGAAPVVEPNGDLLLCSGAGEIRHRAPYAYQNIAGKEVPVESRYDVRGDRIGFSVGAYDRSEPLIIDPMLDFARGVFPLHRLSSKDLKRDTAGNLYLAATVYAPTAKTLGATTNGLTSDDVLIAKLNPEATQVLFTTYIGGTDDETKAYLALGAGDVFVAGTTWSGDFPATPGVYGEIVKGRASRGFVTRLDGTTGAVKYSTYLAPFLGFATAEPSGIVVDALGQAIIAQGYLTKLSADGTTLLFSSPMPGSITAIDIDADGFIYVGGSMTSSSPYVATEGAYQRTSITNWLHYIAKASPSGEVVLSTYLPGSGGIVDLAVDSARNVVVTFPSDSVVPVTPGAYRPTPFGGADAAIMKISASFGSLLASTFYGGSIGDNPRGIAIGPSDTIYLTMLGGAGDFPMVGAIQSDRFLPVDTVIAKFNANLTNLLFATYYGPSFNPVIALDGAGNIYLMVVNGGKEEDGIWLRGSQVPYGHYATTQIARINVGPANPGFRVDYLERKTAPANRNVQGKYHIRGSGFQQGAQVLFDEDQPASISGIFAGGTAIKFLTPNHDIGVVDVTVRNPDSSTVILSDVFTYQEGDNTIESVSGTVDTLGNGTLTLTATRVPAQPVVRVDLRTNSSFFVGRHDLSPEVLTADPTSVTFKLGPFPNYVDSIYFSIPHPTDVASNVFTRLDATHIVPVKLTPPTITEMRPNSGSTSGGGSVTVIGANFHPDSRVVIGDVWSRSVTYINSGSLLATIPPNTGGSKTVQVVNPNELTGSAANLFTYRGITSITPISGPVTGNADVTITGVGFAAPVSVSFGGAAATNVTLVNSTTVTAKTPAHAAGFVDVVMNSGSDTFTLKSAYRFLEAAPTISSVSPASGPEAGGTTIAVHGTGFRTGVKVFIDGTPAQATLVDATRIDAVTPPGTPGLADVKVENLDTQTVTASSIYTYTGIDRLIPVKGSPGALISVRGGGFAAGATVMLGTTPATDVQVISSTEIRFTVPAATPGIVDVVVNTNSQTFTESGFQILAPPPTITGLAPATGFPGDSVVITGTNFVFVTTVTFATDKNALFTVDSPTQITAIVPPTAATGTIKVTTDSGNVTSADTYTVQHAAAEIASFSPAAGSPGMTVTITGAKMGGASSVRFNGVEADSFILNGTTEITAVVPEGGSSGPICITTPGGFNGCSGTSFRYPPVVTGFTPSNGVPGDTITVNGLNFVNVTGVKFGSGDATTFVVDGGGTSLTATVPANATTGQITVTNDAGFGLSTASFGVRPVISSFTPTRAGVGALITINGLRLGATTSMTIGGASAAFTIVSDTQLTATVPANAVDGPIFVVTPGGTAVSSTSFIVALTPNPATFSPTNGPAGTAVTITGSNFNTTTEVRFNGVQASFTVVSNTQINAVVPAAASTGPITLVNTEGQGVTSAKFYLPPVISSFAPNAGAIGTNAVINGNNFIDATEVKINSVATTFVVNGQDKITFTVPAAATTGPITVVTPGGFVTSTLSFSVTSASTPTIGAIATSASQILVTWTGDPSHTYQVLRTEQRGTPLSIRATVTGTTFVDTGVVAGKSYLYTIKNVTNGLIGNADTATTILFTDDPVTAGMRVKLVHLTQLRAAINSMRVVAGLAPRTWTDTNPVLIRAVHINEMRTALSEAYVQLYQYVTFTDSPLPANMVVRSAHFTELRIATK